MIEWVKVELNKAVVATEERAWLHRLDNSGNDPFAEPMPETSGSRATTRQLLDGVIAVAQSLLPRTAARPVLTAERWAWRLAGYYHTTHATPRLMAEAAGRFAAIGKQELADYSKSKVEDEGGHDQLALRDLEALGYDAERLATELVPPTAAALVDYFTELVRAENPAGCVGYAYALERLATTHDKDYLRQVEAVLPPNIKATRCLRVHSSMSADAEHVEEALEVTANQLAEDRRLIALAAYRTTQICCSPPIGGHIPETELRYRLSAFVSKPQVSRKAAGK